MMYYVVIETRDTYTLLYYIDTVKCEQPSYFSRLTPVVLLSTIKEMLLTLYDGV